MKRPNEDDELEDRPNKILRVLAQPQDRLSRLSDELLLRVLSFVPITTLNICQRYEMSLVYPELRLIPIGFRTGCTKSQQTLNYGKPHTITALSVRELLKYPVPPLTTCLILRNCQNGSTKQLW